MDYIEGGYAGANPKDDEFFSRIGELDLEHAVVAAFGSTRRAGLDASEDPALNALADCPVEVVTIVGKASASQVRTVLECSLEENLAMVADSIRYLVGSGRRVFFDAEHFFDGHKEEPDYSLQVLRAAADAGAERLVLCDTNGGTLPREVADDYERSGKSLRRSTWAFTLTTTPTRPWPPPSPLSRPEPYRSRGR